MSYLITATGKEFLSDYVVTIPNPPFCFIRIIGSDIETVRKVFGDPSETNTLTYANLVLTGYTKLGDINDEGDALKVRLEHE